MYAVQVDLSSRFSVLVFLSLLEATLSHYNVSLPAVFAGPRLHAVNLCVSCDHECKLRALWPVLTTFLTLPGGTLRESSVSGIQIVSP